MHGYLKLNEMQCNLLTVGLNKLELDHGNLLQWFLRTIHEKWIMSRVFDKLVTVDAELFEKRRIRKDRTPYPLIAAHSQPSQSTFIKAIFLLIPMIWSTVLSLNSVSNVLLPSTSWNSVAPQFRVPEKRIELHVRHGEFFVMSEMSEITRKYRVQNWPWFSDQQRQFQHEIVQCGKTDLKP